VDGDQKHKRKRRRSGSSSSRESRKSPNYEPMTKKIPSLLDLSPTAMGRNSGSARRGRVLSFLKMSKNVYKNTLKWANLFPSLYVNCNFNIL
jgi:hypothetical protein